MLDFTFSEEQEIIRESARAFCKKEISPRIRDMIKQKKIDPELIKKMAQQGFFGLTIPEKYGGSNRDADGP